jgi:hypothetical protein
MVYFGWLRFNYFYKLITKITEISVIVIISKTHSQE